MRPAAQLQIASAVSCNETRCPIRASVSPDISRTGRRSHPGRVGRWLESFRTNNKEIYSSRKLADAISFWPFVPVAAFFVGELYFAKRTVERLRSELFNKNGNACVFTANREMLNPPSVAWPCVGSTLAADNDPIKRASICAIAGTEATGEIMCRAEFVETR